MNLSVAISSHCRQTLAAGSHMLSNRHADLLTPCMCLPMNNAGQYRSPAPSMLPYNIIPKLRAVQDRAARSATGRDPPAINILHLI